MFHISPLSFLQICRTIPYILCCDWNFSPQVNPAQTTQTNMANNWPVCIFHVTKLVHWNLVPRGLFCRPFRLFPTPTNCQPWVSEDGLSYTWQITKFRLRQPTCKQIIFHAGSTNPCNKPCHLMFIYRSAHITPASIFWHQLSYLSFVYVFCFQWCRDSWPCSDPGTYQDCRTITPIRINNTERI